MSIHLKDAATLDAEVELFGRSRAALDLEIAAAGGGKAYARAMLIALDGYLQICERSPRGPDQRYVRLALNGVKFAISEHLVAAPPSLVHPAGPIAAFAAAAEHLYFPDEGDGLRLPLRACVGRYGVDASLAATSLLSDAQERVNHVGNNGYVRQTLGVARHLLDAMLDLNGRPAPKSLPEDGEIRVMLAADAMRQATREAAVGESGAADETITLVVHLMKQARSILGCGMSDDGATLSALDTVRDIARTHRAGLPSQRLPALSAMATEYAAAGRGEDPWLEPQVADGSGDRYLPVMFVGETCWQLRGVADEAGEVTPLDGADYERVWNQIGFLRNRQDRNLQPAEGLEHLKWVQVTGPGVAGASAAAFFSAKEIVERIAHAPATRRQLAMG
ncbi:hypothetical protein [Dolichospermum phage Dfl-JY45]